MSIRHAMLGLLAEQPMHGYRLKEAFAERVSPLWGLTTGQIYQSLAALERSGYLESRGERKGRRPARRVYFVTEAGRSELNAWLREAPDKWMRPFRDDLLLRLMFLRESEVRCLRESLVRQEREATLLLARATQLSEPRASACAAVDVRGTFLEGLGHHLEADIKVLQRCREEVERWATSRALDVGSDRRSTHAAGDRSTKLEIASPHMDTAARYAATHVADERSTCAAARSPRPARRAQA